MAALGALSGMRIDVTDEDLKRAERVGDMPKRDAVQTADVEVALQYATAEDAKAAGNAPSRRRSTARRWRATSARSSSSTADATDRRRILNDIADSKWSTKSDALAALRATLLSNTAAALLKLARPRRRWRRARGRARWRWAHGRPMSKSSSGAWLDVSKAHYRAAQAHEQLKEFGLALEALGRAAAGGGEPKLMARERARVQRLADQAERDAKARKAQLDREAAAEALRAAGTPLAAPPAGARRRRRRESGGGGGSNGGSGYLSERDLSHWAAQWLAERVKGLRHVGWAAAGSRWPGSTRRRARSTRR